MVFRFLVRLVLCTVAAAAAEQGRVPIFAAATPSAAAAGGAAAAATKRHRGDPSPCWQSPVKISSPSP